MSEQIERKPVGRIVIDIQDDETFTIWLDGLITDTTMGLINDLTANSKWGPDEWPKQIEKTEFQQESK